MKMDKLDDYLKDIEIAQEKTKGFLTIYKGLEIEYWDSHEEYYTMLEQKVDYMIHGQHYVIRNNDLSKLVSSFDLTTVEEIYLYADFMIEAMRSGRFLFHAHPDLFMCGYKVWDKDTEEVSRKILQVAKETNSIFEYNANGNRRGSVMTPLGKQPLYPRIEFWSLVKEYGIKTTLSSDCHQPHLLYDDTMKDVEKKYNNLELNDVGIIKL